MDRTTAGRARRRSRATRLSILLVIAALTAAACGGSDGDGGDGASGGDGDGATQPQRGGSLVYGIEGETASWAPAEGQWSASSWVVVSALYDTLMYYDEEYDLRPYLAESMEPNEDHTVWTLKLRPDISFHNGEALDADAVLRNMEAQQLSPLTSLVLGPVLAVEKEDELTVRFELANSWVHFPQILAGQIGMMAAPEMLDSPDGSRNPIGTGPFEFQEWNPDANLEVVANPDYWAGEPYLNEIEFRVVPDPVTRGAALTTGEIDVALITASPDVVSDASGGADVEVYRPEEGEVTEVFIVLNQQTEPWDDPELRRALVMATDTELMVNTLAEGLYEPAEGIWSPSSPWYVETGYPAFDPEAAAEIVAAWEEENGEELSLELLGPPWPIVLEGGQLLEQMWEGVGVDVDIQTLELTQHILRVVTGDFEGAVWQYHGSPHPDGEFVFLHSQYIKPAPEISLNFARNDNSAIDEALLEARYTEDEERQRELYGQVQEELAQDLPYVFLWHARDGIAAEKGVHDLVTWTLPTGQPGLGMLGTRHRFHQIWVDQ